MGVLIKGVRELHERLEQTGDRVERGVFAKMKQEAEKIERLAKDYAPILHGKLEKSIYSKPVGAGKRDALGRFMRQSVEVGVNRRIRGFNGEPIMRYAPIMHEQLMPYGSGRFNLGRLSRVKAAGGKDVGGLFLERAVAEVYKGMMGRFAEASRQSLDGGFDDE